MMSSLLHRFRVWILFYLHAQLIITIYSMPILLWWGLPISSMATVGNLIFSPLLVVFLLVSSLIFVSELLCIPNGLLIWLLDATSQCMKWLLSLGSKGWLIPFAKPHPIFLWGVPLLTLILYFRLPLHTIVRKLSLLSCSLILSLSFLALQPYLSWEKVLVVPGSKDKLIIIQHADRSLSVLDDGHFNSKGSPAKYVAFELRPYLISNFGTTRIRELTLSKASLRSFQAADAICLYGNVERLYLPTFKSLKNNRAWQAFFSMKKTAELEGTAIKRTKGKESLQTLDVKSIVSDDEGSWDAAV